MSSKIEHLHDIFKQQLQDFIDSSNEEIYFSVTLDGEDGDDISVSISAEKIENEEEGLDIDQAMDIEEFQEVQGHLNEFLKDYKVPFVSMIMLFANQLAFSSLKLPPEKARMASLAFSKAFSMFTIMHRARDIGGYENMVEKVHETLVKELS